MTRQEIVEQYEGYYFRGVNNLNDIEKNSIDIFDEYLLELSGGQEKIEEKLMENNFDSWTAEIFDNGNLKITYPGVNCTELYIADLQDSYDYLVVIEGDCMGLNYFDDLPVIKIKKIVAIFDKTGNQIK